MPGEMRRGGRRRYWGTRWPLQEHFLPLSWWTGQFRVLKRFFESIRVCFAAADNIRTNPSQSNLPDCRGALRACSRSRYC